MVSPTTTTSTIKVKSLVRRASAFALALLAIGTVGLSATKSASADLKFASVDLQKVFSLSKDKATADQDLQKFGGNLQAAFQLQQQGIMLSATELKSLGQLATKTAPTDADKASIQALLAKSKKDADELTALQQKKESDLTDSDKLKLSTLTAQGQAGQQSLNDINQDYRSQLDQKSQELNGQISAHMKDVIAQVAAKQSITVVFDSTVAVYTSLDITKDVLAILNK